MPCLELWKGQKGHLGGLKETRLELGTVSWTEKDIRGGWVRVEFGVKGREGEGNKGKTLSPRSPRYKSQRRYV